VSVADRTEPEERSSVLACLNDTASLTHSLTHLLHTHTHTSHYSPPRSLTLFIRIVDLESNCCVVPESCPPHSPTLPLPHSPTLTPPLPHSLTPSLQSRAMLPSISESGVHSLSLSLEQQLESQEESGGAHIVPRIQASSQQMTLTGYSFLGE
jgi:hypothetical protein